MPFRRVDVLGAGAIVLAASIAVLGIAVRNNNDDTSSVPERDPLPEVDVAVVGDSFAQLANDQIKAEATRRGLTASVDYYGGSALCTWMEHIERRHEDPPPVLVLSFAGNNFDPCVNHGDTDQTATETAAAYRPHLEQVLDLYADSPTKLYVVLPPPIGEEQYEARAEAMRVMYRAVASDRPEMGLIDSATGLDPTGTGFQATLPCAAWDACPANGQVQVRDTDKIHMTPAGAERYARAVFTALGL